MHATFLAVELTDIQNCDYIMRALEIQLVTRSTIHSNESAFIVSYSSRGLAGYLICWDMNQKLPVVREL